MTLYVLDANIFIEAHRRTYPLDVVKSFWTSLENLSDERKIISIDKVKKEIDDGKEDDLKKWINTNISDPFFSNTQNDKILQNYEKVIKWAVSHSKHYLPKAIEEFSDSKNSDAFIISFCLQSPQDYVLVTQEVSEPDRKSKIKIPDVCKNFKISCVNTIEMFRKLGESF